MLSPDDVRELLAIYTLLRDRSGAPIEYLYRCH